MLIGSDNIKPQRVNNELERINLAHAEPVIRQDDNAIY